MTSLSTGAPVLALALAGEDLLVGTAAAVLRLGRQAGRVDVLQSWPEPAVRARGNAERLVTARESGELTVWDRTGAVARPGAAPVGPLTVGAGPTVAFAEGREVVTWRGGRRVRSDLPRGALGEVRLLSLSPGGDRLLIGTGATLSVWLRSSSGEDCLDGHLDPPREAVWDPDGRRFATRDDWPMVLTWAESAPGHGPEPVQTVTPDSAPNLGGAYGPMALGPHGLAVVTSEGLALISTPGSAPALLPTPDPAGITALAWWGPHLVRGHDDGTIRLHRPPQ